jgi:hypothetical protein
MPATARRELDWKRTGTVQAMGEWVRAEVGATVVLAVRASDAVLLTDPQIMPGKACELVTLYLPRLTEWAALERRGKHRWAMDGAPKGRAEWLQRESDAICVLVIRPHDSVLLVDMRCKPNDAEQLVLEYLPELAAHFGESTKYKGARLVLEPCPE